MIDLHCHIDLYPNPVEVLKSCHQHDVFVLSVTTTPSAWPVTSSLPSPDQKVQTALGLHPQVAHEREEELDLFDELLQGVQWVGEIGLDGGREYGATWSKQVRVFQHILRSCRATGGRLMSIHSRRAAAQVLDQLRRIPEAGTPILHWFSGTKRELKDAIERECWFSVGYPMLRLEKGRALVAEMPREYVLTETDGPFVKLDGGPIRPWDVHRVEKELSAVWHLSLENTREILAENLSSLMSPALREER